MAKLRDEEDRKQQQLRRLGSKNPICVTCGESDPRVLELHHIAGRKNHENVAIVCANCHRKFSDKQRDHHSTGSRSATGVPETIAHYLQGLADLLVMIADALRRFAVWLIEQATCRQTR